MTIYFMGSEVGAFTPLDANSYEDAAGAVDTAFNRACIRSEMSVSTARSATFSALPSAFYVHAKVYHHFNGTAEGYTCTLSDGTTSLFRIKSDSNSLQMQHYIGAAWTNLGSSVAVDLSSPQDVDIFIDTAGTAKLYLSGALRVTASATLTAITGITQFIHGPTNVNNIQIAHVVIADEPTIGWRLVTVPITGAGATTDWTGTYAEVDEMVYSDADFINSATAAQVELFAHSTAIPSGYRVQAVGVSARAKKGGSGPTKLQLALRSAGTTYFSGDKALDVGYDSYEHIWETDPATSAAFTTSAIAALQFGVKSIA